MNSLFKLDLKHFHIFSSIAYISHVYSHVTLMGTIRLEFISAIHCNATIKNYCSQPCDVHVMLLVLKY